MNTTIPHPHNVDLQFVQDNMDRCQDEVRAKLQELTAGMNPDEKATFTLAMMVQAGFDATEMVGMPLVKSVATGMVQSLPQVLGHHQPSN